MSMEEPTGRMTDADRDRMLWQIHTAVVGANGQGGLIEKVKDNTKNILINTNGLVRLKVVVTVSIILGVGGGLGVNVDKLVDFFTRTPLP